MGEGQHHHIFHVRYPICSLAGVQPDIFKVDTFEARLMVEMPKLRLGMPRAYERLTRCLLCFAQYKEARPGSDIASVIIFDKHGVELPGSRHGRPCSTCLPSELASPIFIQRSHSVDVEINRRSLGCLTSTAIACSSTFPACNNVSKMAKRLAILS